MRLEALNNRPDTRFGLREATRASTLAFATLIASGSATSASSPEENFSHQDPSLLPAPEHVLDLPSIDPKVIFENAQIVVENPDYAQEKESESFEEVAGKIVVLKNKYFQ